MSESETGQSSTGQQAANLGAESDAPSSHERWDGELLRALTALDEIDLREHPDIYQDMHAQLQDALGSIDDA